MSPLTDFLTAIRLAPDDDGLRLVFADWLEENDKRTWANVLRRQIYRDPDAQEPNWSEAAKSRDVWFPRLPSAELEQLAQEMGYPIPLAGHFVGRGLPAQVTLDAAEFLEVGEALAAWGPMPTIRLTNVTPHLDALARSSALVHVQALILESINLTDDDLRALLDSPHLHRLTDLNLGKSWSFSGENPNTLTAASARLLAATSALPALRRLNLHGNPLGDDGLLGLGRGPTAPRLTALGLDSCRITGTAFEAWEEAVPFPQLRYLSLRMNQLIPAGGNALVRSPQLATLDALNLKGTDLTDGAASLFASSAHPTRLRYLDLSMNSVSDDGFIALCRAPALTGLRRLKLHYFKGGPRANRSPIGPRGAAALRSAAFAPSLAALELGSQNLGDAGLEALAATAEYANLKYLDLGSNAIGDAGARALAATKHFQALECLNLRFNQIGPAGAEALTNWPELTRIRSLSVCHNPLGPPGVDLELRCVRATADGDLRLRLDEKRLGDEGIARLVARPELEHCRAIYLRNNGVTARGAQLLAACPALRSLRELELDLNSIEDAGAVALAASPHLTQLEKLSLGNCGLTDSGVVAVVSSPVLADLHELHLYGNTLTAVALTALTAAAWPKLEQLSVGIELTATARAELEARFGDRVKFY